MRTMKKVLAAGLTAVKAMSLMVGCGSKKDDIAITAVNPAANTFFIALIISSPFYLSCTFLQIEKKKSPKQICLRRIIRGTTQIDTRCVHLNHILSYMPTLVTGRVPGDSYLLLSKSPSKVHSPGKSYCNLTTCSSL